MNPFNTNPIVTYAQNMEDVMLWRALGHIQNGFYIDVGANDPSHDSVTLAFYEKGWHGINVEPLPTHFNALKAARQRDINLPCALGQTPGSFRLWDCGIRGWASLDPVAIADHIAQGYEGVYLDVEVKTLADVAKEYVQGEVHFLKVDVEGFEKDVLLGADFQSFRPWILILEATRPNSTIAVHEEWEYLVTDHQYQFAYTDGINRFYVAQEHPELIEKLRHPPNIFDQYTKVTEVELRAEVAQWKSKYEAAAANLLAQPNTLAKAPEICVLSQRQPKLFVDVSSNPVGTQFGGIARVISNFMTAWITSDQTQWGIHPVCCNEAGSHFVSDTSWETTFLRRGAQLHGDAIRPLSGDVFLVMTGRFELLSSRAEYFRSLQARGVRVIAFVYDFLPLFLKEDTPAWVSSVYENYTRTLFLMDGVICISAKVAQEFQGLVTLNGIELSPHFSVAWSHLGSNLPTMDPQALVGQSAIEALASKRFFPDGVLAGTAQRISPGPRCLRASVG